MEDSKAFIEKLFISAINLYGAIFLCDLWEIYKFCGKKNKYPEISLDDMTAFAKECIGEDKKFTIILIEDLYESQLPRLSNCVIANNRLVLDKFNKYELIVRILQTAADKPYFIPANLLSYEQVLLTVVEKEAEEILGKLVVTNDKFVTKWKTTIPCANVGKKLSEFDFLNQDEQFRLDYISGKIEGGPKCDEKKVNQYMEYHAGPENLKLIREYKWKTSTASLYPIEAVDYVLSEIAETGAVISDEERMEVSRILIKIYNTSRLWILRGWQPKQINKTAHETDENIPNSIGPGAQKALANGDIPCEKLVEAIRSNGF